MPTVKKSQSNKWTKELFFVLACVGAAVGVGNLWRFPYMAYENGGGAFLLPYLACLLLVGLPIALLEIGVGCWGGGSLPQGFQKVNRRWTWVGWWALVNSIVIVFYYAVVLGWCVQYVVYSVTEAWGSDPAAFFLHRVVGFTGSPFKIGGISPMGVISIAVVWLTIFLIVRTGTRGLSRVLLFTVPLPAILLVTLAVRSLSMEGAGQGVAYFFTPKVNKLLSGSVWAAAASQVVLSLGLGMGQMVAYASKKKDDYRILRSGISICLLDLAFSLLAGLTVFGTMGFLAASQGISINDLKLDGIFLAFVSYPMAISTLPFAPLWGVLFFTLLVSLGIDSAFAAIEATLTGCEEIAPKRTRNLLAGLLCGLGFLGGLFFTTGSGLQWLDIVDHWVAYYSIAAIIILECVVFGVFGPLKKIGHRLLSNWPRIIQRYWYFLVAFVIPIALTIIFGLKATKEFSAQYSDYPYLALAIGGWGISGITVVAGIILGVFYNRRKKDI